MAGPVPNWTHRKRHETDAFLRRYWKLRIQPNSRNRSQGGVSILSLRDSRSGRTARCGQQSAPRSFAGARRQAIPEVNRARVLRFRPKPPRRTGASPGPSARERLSAALPSACRARLARGFARAFPLKRPRPETKMSREAAAQAARGPSEPTVAREARRDRLSPRSSRLRKRTLPRGMACRVRLTGVWRQVRLPERRGGRAVGPTGQNAADCRAV